MPTYSIYLILVYIVLLIVRPTRKFALILLPWLIFACTYDWMRIFPNYEVNTIDIRPLYENERQLFGITTESGRVILGEYFSLHHSAWADILAGLFYLCWVPVPLVYSISLFFRGKHRQSLRMGVAFLWINVIGFAIYYIHPAAPPWYVLQYGFDPLLNVPGDVAGMGRFDSLLGVTIFHHIYSENANVFAAVPSLHSAYVLATAIYVVLMGDKRWLAVLFTFITMGIWCAAVYSCHHYVIDVILGILTAILAILILEQGLRRIPFLRRAYNAYANKLNP